MHQPSGAVESIDCLQSCDISRTISCKLILVLCIFKYIYINIIIIIIIIIIIYSVIERCGFGYLSKVLHLPSPSNMLGQPMCEGDSFLRSWFQLGSRGSIKARAYSIPITPVVKVDGSTPKRWIRIRCHDKPIHESCVIYFRGGIFHSMPFTLSKTNSSHLKIGQSPKQKNCLPTLHFQVQAGRFRE